MQGYIQKGIDEGAVVAAGGLGKPEGKETGYFVKPTVLANVTNDMTVAQEEIFGPVLSIIGYEDEDDAVRIANDSLYGLSGGVWSADKDRAIAVARRMRTGAVDVNGGSFNIAAPFGGYKQSGLRPRERPVRHRRVPADQVAAAVILGRASRRVGGGELLVGPTAARRWRFPRRACLSGLTSGRWWGTAGRPDRGSSLALPSPPVIVCRASTRGSMAVAARRHR